MWMQQLCCGSCLHNICSSIRPEEHSPVNRDMAGTHRPALGLIKKKKENHFERYEQFLKVESKEMDLLGKTSMGCAARRQEGPCREQAANMCKALQDLAWLIGAGTGGNLQCPFCSLKQ